MTDNWIGETGMKSLSESLKTNTTLTKLDLSCKHTQKALKCSFFFHSLYTGNDVGNRGATSLSDALSVNTTLTHLDICCKHKRVVVLSFFILNE